MNRNEFKQMLREEIEDIVREKEYNLFGRSITQLRTFFINNIN